MKNLKSKLQSEEKRIMLLTKLLKALLAVMAMVSFGFLFSEVAMAAQLLDLVKAGTKPISDTIAASWPVFLGLGGISGYFLGPTGDNRQKISSVVVGLGAGYALCTGASMLLTFA